MKTFFVSSYQGKKVFLTGHTGFKGAWLLSWLHMLGATVKGYALEAEQESLYRSIDGDDLCDSVIADIRDRRRLEREILDFQPDYIFHLAAQPLVRVSYDQPVETFETNITGTVYLLESIRKLEKKCSVVIVTTDKVYEDKGRNHPYRESDRLGGYDPYSASKAACEIVVSSYRNSFFNSKDRDRHQKGIASARAGNVIGGGDWSKDRIIPDIVKSIAEKKPVIIRNPKAVRPWQYVLEPISGYLFLGGKLNTESNRYAGAWNFGPLGDSSLTVKDLVDQFIAIWGEGVYETDSSEALHETTLLRLDVSKAINEMNWRPKFSETESIRRTITWYKRHTQGESISLIQEIEEYMSL